LHKMDSVVHYTSFSRNFGKEAGLYAGLQRAQGDYVTVMDVDLQDPPELLPQMLQLVREQKYDVVATRRANRKGEAIIRSWFSKQFYKVMNKISDVPLVDGARDYRIMTRQVVDSLLKLSENQRFSKGMFNWVGFKVKYISFENVPRSGGVSSWSFWSLSKYAVQGIVSFSTVPLTVITYIGITTFLMSIISAIFVVIRAVIYHNSASGWASMVTIMLFIGGIQLLSLGVIGRYLSSIFLEVKDRPIYITKEMDKN
ncbi:glycosyltransferase family 2 protein, partial [Leuconostoc mesenteroides]|uniref:glycosyltransferase family 2 protein n=3 Tax=Leuconostoc TaxID=1243 RepID=UPI00235F52D7